MSQCNYMHTLNGEPASFNGEQICFADKRIKLVDSWRQIKKEQQASRKWRLKYVGSNDYKEGYVTIDQ